MCRYAGENKLSKSKYLKHARIMLQFDGNFSDKGMMFRPFNASWPLRRRILRKLTYRSLLQ